MKKTHVLIAIVALLSWTQNTVQAQTFKTATGIVSFTSKTDFETFEAINNQVSAAYSKGKIQFRVPVNAFIFEKKLMQTHFQENYMESAKYPNGSFKGTVIYPENFKLSTKAQNVKVKGIFNIHGVEKETEISGSITQTKTGILLSANFSILLNDFNINIPVSSINKIAQNIDIRVDAQLTAK
jgi:polyisoprenoid-binding protein YceI